MRVHIVTCPDDPAIPASVYREAKRLAIEVVSHQWPTSDHPWAKVGQDALIVIITRKAVSGSCNILASMEAGTFDGPQTLYILADRIPHQKLPNGSVAVRKMEWCPTTEVLSNRIIEFFKEILGEEYMPEIADGDPTRLLFGDAPETGTVFGREGDINQLKHIYSADGIRRSALALIGIGGRGKTALARTLMEEFALEFEAVVWFSMHSRPPISELAQTLAQLARSGIETHGASTTDTTADVETLLRNERILLVLDNYEAIMPPKGIPDEGTREDRVILEGIESGYNALFQKIRSQEIRSLVIITSREQPAGFSGPTNRHSRNCFYRLPGLNERAVHQIVKESGLTITDQDALLLKERVDGNPLDVRLVCGYVHDYEGGNISRFLQNHEVVNDIVGSILNEYSVRLTALDRIILYWLAISVQPQSEQDLFELLRGYDLTEFRASLQHCIKICLAVADQAEHTQVHPVVKQRLVKDVCTKIGEEISIKGDTQSAELFRDILLVDPYAADYVQHLQRETIKKYIEPVLRRNLGGFADVRNQILSLFEWCCKRDKGYSAANTLEVARALGISLEGRDLSGLMFDKADLRGLDLRNADLRNSEFSNITFSDNFGPVTAVTIMGSPDGPFILGGTFEGHLRVWDIQGRLINVFRGASDWVSSLTPVSIDRVAVSSVDGSIRFINIQSGETEVLSQTKGTQVRSLCYDGGHRLLGVSTDGHLRSFDTRGLGAAEPKTWAITDFRLKVVRLQPKSSPSVVAVGGDSHDVLFVDIQTGEILQSLTIGKDWVRDLAFSADGMRMYTANDSGDVGLWHHSIDGWHLQAMGKHAHRVWCLFLCETTSRLYSAGTDSVIRVWSASDLTPIATFTGHSSWVRGMAGTPDGSILATGGEDQTLRVWNALDGRCLRKITGYAHRIFSVTYQASGNIICGTGDHKVLVLQPEAAALPKAALLGHGDQVFTVAASLQNNFIASGSDNGEVRIWVGEPPALVFAQQLHSGWLGSLAFSQDSRILASGADDRSVCLIDTETMTVANRRTVHNGRVSGLAFHGTSHLFSISEDGFFRVLNAATIEVLSEIRISQSPLYAMAVASNILVGIPPAVLTGGADGVVRKLNLSDNTLEELVHLRVPIWSISIAPTGRFAAIGTDTGNLVLIDLQDTSNQQRSIAAHSRQIWSVAWNPDGSHIATASEDGTVRVWDAITNEIHWKFESPRVYEGVKLNGSVGLSVAERALLVNLGAVGT